MCEKHLFTRILEERKNYFIVKQLLHWAAWAEQVFPDYIYVSILLFASTCFTCDTLEIKQVYLYFQDHDIQSNLEIIFINKTKQHKLSIFI